MADERTLRAVLTPVAMGSGISVRLPPSMMRVSALRSTGATRVTDDMLMASSEALAKCSPLVTGERDSLLPPIANIREASKKIAKAVALQAMEDVAITISEAALEEKISKNFWEPEYRNYRRTSF